MPVIVDFFRSGVGEAGATIISCERSKWRELSEENEKDFLKTIRIIEFLFECYR